MAVWFLQLCLSMKDLVAISYRIKRPAIPPADVQDAFGPVKVSSDAVLLRIIFPEMAVLPGARKVFEFVNGGQMVRRIGGLFLFVQDRRAADGTAARAKNSPGILFFGPPQDLIQPMNSPVAESSVGVIQKTAPAAGMQLAIKW